MTELTNAQIIQELRKFDTATICNVVATYGGSDLCLSMYDSWWGEYYTDTSLRCWYPELSPACGYAATTWYSDKKPEYVDVGRFAMEDHLDSTPKPVIWVCKQSFSSPELANLCGLMGGIMTSKLKAFGVVGVVTDGPFRDLEEIRPMKVQYLAPGVTSGHGNVMVRGAGMPVTVAGMTVQPGDIVHMDQCGACKFPAKYLPQVLDLAKKLIAREEEQKAVFQDPRFNYARWKEAQLQQKK